MHGNQGSELLHYKVRRCVKKCDVIQDFDAKQIAVFDVSLISLCLRKNSVNQTYVVL